MSKWLVVLLVAVLASSGCVSGDNPQNSANVDTNQGVKDSTVETYTESSDNTTITVKVDHSTESYNFSHELRKKYTSSEFFSRYEALNMTAYVGCDWIQGLTYENAEFTEKWGLSSEDSDIPGKILKNYEPNSVKSIYFNEDKSKKLASCKPTQNNLNVEILVDEEY